MSNSTRERMLDSLRRQNPEVIAAIARRSFTVAMLKKTLPVVAVGLLVALVLAPSWRAGPDANRVSYHVSANSAPPSRMQGAKYHGTDQQGQPFTVTANSAEEQDADDVVLTAPMADLTLKSGAWLMLKSDNGLFHQQSQKLGLTGNVTLYRNDGTVLTSPEASIDLHAGTALGVSPVMVQGPFGTLTAAHGFFVANRGTDITFNGPATLTLTQAQ